MKLELEMFVCLFVVFGDTIRSNDITYMVTSGLYFHVKVIFSANQSTTSLPTLRY